jgi:hypothetical protein
MKLIDLAPPLAVHTQERYGMPLMVYRKRAGDLLSPTYIATP